MKNQVPWWGLLGGAVVSYILQVVIGGIVGDCLGLLALILLLMGIIEGVRAIRRKK